MSIEPLGYTPIPAPQPVSEPPTLIESDQIKAILYLGIKGEVILPDPERTIDILA